ncbi:FMN-dependent NADH-azoreductase [Hymenobacter ginsengisoli]|uniref:FMN dependent NADH:quinone oxidoreductase n=1 Tax=Hymenobacter ginsengisoli TaxID=1051626 RepID=A0ABP8Q540_9BACT|nr:MULTISPECIES: NAD(P)H-dependent oxidoreductase [unclassified Hymenobacter]MBO2031835.1 NAD(P)H-dependent oxidoreductase [Hymenobacter sp. BT559]
MHILHVISSPRSSSFSIQLGHQIVEKLLAAHPGSTVRERNLATHPMPHLEEAYLQSMYTPAEARTPAQQAALRHSDEAIQELLEADVLVLGAPFYNFGIPATLKSWIDHLCRSGITFSYTAAGPKGLITGKKVYVALSSGGVYSEGPMAVYDFVAPYLRATLGFLGLTDMEVVRVEGTAVPELAATALPKAIASIEV